MSFLTLHAATTDKGASVNKPKNTLFMALYRDAAASLHKVLCDISVKLKECYHSTTSFKKLYFCLLVKIED